MDEGSCAPCPSGTMTSTSTSANCYCVSGSYAQVMNNADNNTMGNNNCTECEAGNYCEGGNAHTNCPSNSNSKRGSKTRGDCTCNSGYFGNLANPDTECQRAPLAVHCQTENCTCAKGWDPVFQMNAEDTSLNLSCVTGCLLGQYALINPSTMEKIACIMCPANTYSSSNQTVVVQGKEPQNVCTPCPLNYETNGMGQTSILDCVCTKGVLNTTNSACGMCAPGTYLNTLANICQVCPQGKTNENSFFFKFFLKVISLWQVLHPLEDRLGCFHVSVPVGLD